MDPNVLQLLNGFGGSISISSDNYTMTQNGQNLQYQFSGQLNENQKIDFWKQYQSRINAASLDNAPETSQCLNSAEELIKKKFRPSYECSPLESSQQPEVYFEKAKKLQAIIKEIFLSKVASSHSFSIGDNGFNKKLDKAERLVVHTFHNLFELYMGQENYVQAFDVAKKISASPQGKQAILKLANAYLNQKLYEMVTSSLDAIQGALKAEEMQLFLSQIPEGDAEAVAMLVSALKKMKNEEAKSSIVSALVEKLLREGREDAIDIVVLIKDDYDRRQAYIKVVDFYLKQNNIGKALKTIPNINDDYDRRQNYIKIVDLYINRNTIPQALDIIRYISDDYDRRQNLIKIVNYYKARGEIAQALQIIAKINDSYDRNQEYIKVIDRYLANSNIKEAKKIIDCIDDEYTQEQQKAKFFAFI